MEKKTSQKQIEANRKNAQKSTGPKSENGKSRVSKNAYKHGIFSHDTVIEFGSGLEDPAEFDRVLSELWEHWCPEGGLEEILVKHIAVNYWRLKRVYRYEIGESSRHLNDNRIQREITKIEELNNRVQPTDLKTFSSYTPPMDVLSTS